MLDLKPAEHARFWEDVYWGKDGYSAVMQLRQATALQWI
jgi:hypothetical protein